MKANLNMKDLNKPNLDLEFGVTKGAEKKKEEQNQEIEQIIKMANFGVMFANLIVNSKSEQDFLKECSDLYNKCNPNKTQVENKDEKSEG